MFSTLTKHIEKLLSQEYDTFSYHRESNAHSQQLLNDVNCESFNVNNVCVVIGTNTISVWACPLYYIDTKLLVKFEIANPEFTFENLMKYIRTCTTIN